MPHFKAMLCPLVLQRDKFRKKMKEIPAVGSNRKFLESIPLRGDKNKIQVILESFAAKLQ